MIFDILFISDVIGRCDDWRELMNWKSQRSLRCPPFRQVGPNLCFRYHVTAKLIFSSICQSCCRKTKSP